MLGFQLTIILVPSEQWGGKKHIINLCLTKRNQFLNSFVLQDWKPASHALPVSQTHQAELFSPHSVSFGSTTSSTMKPHHLRTEDITKPRGMQNIVGLLKGEQLSSVQACNQVMNGMQNCASISTFVPNEQILNNLKSLLKKLALPKERWEAGHLFQITPQCSNPSEDCYWNSVQ